MRLDEYSFDGVGHLLLRHEGPDGYHREVRHPGSDAGDLPQEVRDACAARWTEDAVAAWLAWREASLPPPDPEPGPRTIKPMHFICRLTALGKFEAALELVGGPASPDFAELVSADRLSEDEPRIREGLAAIGVAIEEIFGPRA